MVQLLRVVTEIHQDLVAVSGGEGVKLEVEGRAGGKPLGHIIHA